VFHAEVSDYDGLRQALRRRVEQLNVSRNCLDAVSGLPAGYTGKLLAPYGRKKIGGMSFGLIVRAAGLKMVLVDDPDASGSVNELALDHLLKAARLKLILIDDPAALAKVEPMYEPRAAENVRLGNDSRKSKGRRTPKPPRRGPPGHCHVS
jgi:hypothetical protein